MTVAEYHERANELEEKAKQARNLGAKQLYENMARRWRELAEQAESYVPVALS